MLLDDSDELEKMLRLMQAGDPGALAKLAEWALAETHRLAAFAFREKCAATTQSSVISGAVIKLIRSGTLNKAPNLAYLKVAIYQAVSEVLIDHYRKQQRRRRGLRAALLPPDLPWLQKFEEPGFDLLALEEALAELQVDSPRKASVVHLRFFVGMTIREVAAELDISESSVEADWRVARAWLFKRLKDDSEGSGLVAD